MLIFTSHVTYITSRYVFLNLPINARTKHTPVWTYLTRVSVHPSGRECEYCSVEAWGGPINTSSLVSLPVQLSAANDAKWC